MIASTTTRLTDRRGDRTVSARGIPVAGVGRDGMDYGAGAMSVIV
jgi:hypothetical protein